MMRLGFLVQDVGISSDKHALIVPPFHGKRIHPMPFSDSSIPCKFLKLSRVAF
jgi:cellulose synthase A